MKRPKLSSKALIFLILCLVLRTSSAQYYRTGSEPASVRWFQIKTDHIQVIYPEGAETIAQEFTSKFEYALEYMKPNLLKPPKKLSIVLHNFHSQSNGLVSWAPSRMELWTRPPQSLASQDWLELLIIHEYRHFIQISNLQQGFTKALSFVFGQQGQLVPLGLHIPMWYLEGDAVMAETVYSRSGRGRNPSFNQEFRALVMEEGIPRYEDLFLGSFNAYVPDHYRVGYDLVSAHLLYNSNAVFQKKLTNIARHPIYLNPFKVKARGLRDRGKVKLYAEAMHILDSIWNAEPKIKTEQVGERILPPRDDYLDLTALRWNGSGLYMRSESFSSVPTVLRINDNSLEFVKELGVFADDEIDVWQDKLVWVETNTNSRWEQKAFSDLWIMDLQTHKKKRLSHGLYLSSPSFNPKDSSIVAVRYQNDYRFSLLILHRSTGEILHEIKDSSKQVLFHPSWSEDGENLVFISLDETGKHLCTWSKEDGVREILHASFKEISHPIFHGKRIYFTAGFDGINQIYSCTTSGSNMKKHTRSSFGANYAAIDPEKRMLYYAEWHSKGHRLKRQNLAIGDLVKQENIKASVPSFAEQLSKTQGQVIDFENRPDKVYDSTPYRKLLHGFNFHSWYPLSLDLDQGTFYPGISLLSQDILGNSVLALNWNADPSMRPEMFSLKYSYYGLWPNIHLEHSRGGDSGTEVYRGTDIPVDYAYRTTSINLSFPLNFSRHLSYSGITPEIDLGYSSIKTTYDIGAGESYVTQRYVPLTMWLGAYHVKQKARRDLYYPWGIVASLGYSSSIVPPNLDEERQSTITRGSVYGYSLSLYAKGLGAHHSIKLLHTYQGRTGSSTPDAGAAVFASSVLMNNLFSYPRGYLAMNNSNVSMQRLSLDYQLPLAYPDVRLSWFSYIKRVAGGVFADYGRMKDISGLMQNSFSYGGQLYVDTHFFRYEPEVRLGVQLGYNNLSNKSFSNLILSFDMPW